jgi:cell division protein FtsW
MLLCFGVVMVSSSTSDLSWRLHGNEFALLARHLVYVGLGVVALFGAAAIPVRFWREFDWACLIAAIALLVLVLVPGVGREVNGSRRWISLGFMTIQSSELAKLLFVVYLSGHLVRFARELQTDWIAFLRPLVLLAFVVLLLLAEPDFGAGVVIAGSVMGMLFLAGVPLPRYAGLVLLVIAAAVGIAYLQPYRVARLSTFTDPWAHAFSGGYQLAQALIAFGRGGWFGLGLGNSLQKLSFLPEAHTDFVFSVIAEELGSTGALLLVLSLSFLLGRCLSIARREFLRERAFSGYLACGLTLSLALQSAINIGVNLGLLPTKGITLPFISYGGNSLVVSCAMVGVILRIELESRRDARGGRER